MDPRKIMLKSNFISFRMQTRKELYNTLGYTPGHEWIYPNKTK